MFDAALLVSHAVREVAWRDGQHLAASDIGCNAWFILDGQVAREPSTAIDHLIERRLLMIELLPNLPDHIVGISASGQVNAADYETVLIPAIDVALKKHDRIRILYQLGPQFTGFTSGAMWDDMKIGIAHLRAWERIAVVTDHNWIAAATRMFAFAMPCPVKVFSNNELAEAEAWIAA
jgi:hypothetical protein